MFDYHETKLYISDFYTDEEIKVCEAIFNDAFEWHKANRIKMDVCYHETDRFDFTDETMNVSTIHELRSYDFKKCLTFLNISE